MEGQGPRQRAVSWAFSLLRTAHAPALVCGIAAFSLIAQQADTTFKSTTTLVQVTAVVRDRQGDAIGTLSADDFRLLEDGRQRPITQFAVERLRNERQVPAPTRASGPAPTGKAAVLPNHFVAFVVDDQNLIPEHLPQATLAAIRRISAMGPADRAAILSTSGRMLVEFTSDAGKLRRALSSIGSLDRRETFDVSRLTGDITCKITYLKADWILAGDAAAMRNCVPAPFAPAPPRNSLERPPPSGIGPAAASGDIRRIRLENQVRSFAESIVQAGDRDVRSYFAGLATLIDQMSRMPGERSILLLSPGMYIAPRFRSLQDEIISAAVRARVAISGIDPRGVYIRNDPQDPSTAADTWGLAETNSRNGFMEDITSGTGGAFIKGTNDIAGALQRLDAVPEFVYVLGFSPATETLDGKYRALKVQLKRSGGMTVEARRGYYAAVAQPEGGTEAQRLVRDAFFSAREMDDLPVRLTVRSSHKPGENIVLTAIAQVDLGKATFRKEDSVNRSELAFVVGLFDENGKYLKDVQKSADLHPTDEELAALRISGIEVKTDFPVVPGRYFVKLLVRESQGAAGIQTLGVTIDP